jgi:hypothetical protein
MAKGKAGDSDDEFSEEEEYKESEVSLRRAWRLFRARRVACRSTPQRSPPRWHSPRPQEDVSEEEEDVGRHRKKDKKKKRGKGFIDDAAEEVRVLGPPGAAVGRRPRCVGAGGGLPTAAGARPDHYRRRQWRRSGGSGSGSRQCLALPEPASSFRVHCRTMMHGAASGCVHPPSLMTLQARMQRGGCSVAPKGVVYAGKQAGRRPCQLICSSRRCALRCLACPAEVEDDEDEDDEASSCRTGQPVHPKMPLLNPLSPPTRCPPLSARHSLIISPCLVPFALCLALASGGWDGRPD